MIVLQLFLSFLKIGAIAFGGGYGMLPLIREEVLAQGWLTDDGFMNLVAVSESTPGPIAINAATYVGATQAGILGSIAATVGVILPAFLVMLLIVIILKNIIKYRPVQAFLSGLGGAVTGLILVTGILMLTSGIFGFQKIGDGFSFDLIAAVIIVLITAFSVLWKKFRKKKASPILLIAISAVLGAVCYGLF